MRVRKRALPRSSDKNFPSKDEVAAMRVETQTVDASSKALTEKYTQQFYKTNHLKP